MNNYYIQHSQINKKRLQTLQKLQKLPNIIGIILIGSGLTGMMLPGIAGLPLLLAGGIVLSPWKATEIDGFFHRKFPEAYTTSMKMVDRFLDDLERRYPHKSNKHND